MTGPGRSGGAEPQPDLPQAAVDRKRLDRKARRWSKRGLLGLALFLLTMIALLVLAPDGAGKVIGMLGLLLVAFLATGLGALLPFAIAAIAIYAVVSYYRRSPRRPAAPQPLRSASRGDLSRELAMLETLRTKLARESRRRVLLFVPAALLLASGLYFVGGGTSKSGNPVFAFIVLHTVAGMASWMFAIYGPGLHYALAFKRELLPLLLKPYGELRHGTGSVPPLERLREIGMLPPFARAAVDDFVEGRYRGAAIRLSELHLVQRQNDKDVTVFNGLLIDLGIEAPFRGTTVLNDVDDAGGTPESRGEGLLRIRLEDPVFDEIYRVYATDQIEARAVLTPAVMERLLVMADGKAFLPPRFAIEGRRMSFGLAHVASRNLFEPPPLESHDAAEQLAEVEDQLASIFALADAMIDMHALVRAGPTLENAGLEAAQGAAPPAHDNEDRSKGQDR